MDRWRWGGMRAAALCITHRNMPRDRRRADTQHNPPDGKVWAVRTPRRVAFIGGEPREYEKYLDGFDVHAIENLDRARAYARGPLGRSTWLVVAAATNRLPLTEVAERVRTAFPWAMSVIVATYEPGQAVRCGLYARGVVAVEVAPSPSVVAHLVMSLARSRAVLVAVDPDG